MSRAIIGKNKLEVAKLYHSVAQIPKLVIWIISKS